MQLNTVPFEEAKSAPALQAYLAAYDKVDTKVEPTSLGVQAFSAGLLFATAAKALGDDLTRDNLLTQLRTVHKWDGGGLHFLTDPGANKGSNCFMYMEVKDGEFVRLGPTRSHTCDCDEDYALRPERRLRRRRQGRELMPGPVPRAQRAP